MVRNERKNNEKSFEQIKSFRNSSFLSAHSAAVLQMRSVEEFSVFHKRLASNVQFSAIKKCQRKQEKKNNKKFEIQMNLLMATREWQRRLPTGKMDESKRCKSVCIVFGLVEYVHTPLKPHHNASRGKAQPKSS